MTAAVVQRWLTGTTIIQKPVINLPEGRMPVDAYETPPVMAEHLRLLRPYSVFPWAVTSCRSADIHHPVPWIPGKSNQTRLDNLGPAGRTDHRILTHGRWQDRQPEPGTYLFRAPHGQIHLVNNTGIHPLGDTPFAHAVWHAAAPT